jgi:hypothetical protein
MIYPGTLIGVVESIRVGPTCGDDAAGAMQIRDDLGSKRASLLPVPASLDPWIVKSGTSFYHGFCNYLYFIMYALFIA